jgi:antitoxin (DNA-binding transcriptional repressor) of toxin-antitoxin stability system
MIQGMAATHISIAELADNAAALAERIRGGEQIILEADSHPIALLAPLPQPPGRPISESIAILEARAEQRGYEAVMGTDFAADMEDIIANRKPRDTSSWD